MLRCAPLVFLIATLVWGHSAGSTVDEEFALGIDDVCDSDSSESCALQFRHLRANPTGPASGSLALAESEGKWCDKPHARKLWPPSPTGGKVSVKILSYNLFWWNLYGQRGGNNNSAGYLIKDHMKDQPFDVMGFQECDSVIRVLEPVGLLDEFSVFQGNHAVCVAYRKGVWHHLAEGTDDVGEDMGSHYYGKRGAVWVRLKHAKTGRTMLFVDHHGPLEVNSGGICGGAAVANNLVDLMHRRGQPGDILILVGDFNANSASLTVQEMWSRMVLLHSGTSFGGVDNIFGNMDTASIVSQKTLGSGGSDHNAISVVVDVGDDARILTAGPLPDSEASTAAMALTIAPPKDDWQNFWCGRIEDQVEYVVPSGGWSLTISHNPRAGDSHDVSSPQRCCRLCQRHSHCKSFMWIKWAGNGPMCKLHDSLPTQKKPNSEVASGLSATTAAVLAAAKAKTTAISSLDAVKENVEVFNASTCADAEVGSSCLDAVFWAKSSGISKHPEWYPDLTKDSSLAEFQKAVHASTPDKCPAPCCNDARPGESCYDEVVWARSDGIFAHPDWYPGLTASSSMAEFQKVIAVNSNTTECVTPCRKH